MIIIKKNNFNIKGKKLDKNDKLEIIKNSIEILNLKIKNKNQLTGDEHRSFAKYNDSILYKKQILSFKTTNHSDWQQQIVNAIINEILYDNDEQLKHFIIENKDNIINSEFIKNDLISKEKLIQII